MNQNEMLVRSLDRYKDWEHQETTRFVLEKNEHSRAHKLREAMQEGLLFDGENNCFPAPRDASAMFSGELGAKVFVVRHDWASAFEHSDMGDAEFRLPFQMCLFEFRVTGRTLIVFAWEQDAVAPFRGHTLFLEGVDGLWLTLTKSAVEEVSEFLWRQIRAICIALEAQVAEHSVVRAPVALNNKREKSGKPPISDFHVVDLSRRARAAARVGAGDSGRRVRMHFRRGHWRHYETHNTWIEWMLVGNPDLGFIDKEYRI